MATEGTITRAATRRWEVTNLHPDHGPVISATVEQKVASSPEYTITMRTNLSGSELLQWLISRYGA